MHGYVGYRTRLLTAIGDNPGRHISELSILTGSERRQVTAEWNSATAELPEAGGVHELVAAQAAAHPEATAVVHGGTSLTYAELDARANRLAHHLMASGVGRETVVGLCLERGLDVVVAVLAVWKAGGAYLPLDPGYPADRLAYMLADSRADGLVTHGTRPAAPTAGVVIALDEPAEQATIAGRPGKAPTVTTHPKQ